MAFKSYRINTNNWLSPNLSQSIQLNMTLQNQIRCLTHGQAEDQAGQTCWFEIQKSEHLKCDINTFTQFLCSPENTCLV